MTSDFKKLFTGPGKNYIIPHSRANVVEISRHMVKNINSVCF